jgi:hypothetical protein
MRSLRSQWSSCHPRVPWKLPALYCGRSCAASYSSTAACTAWWYFL